MHFRHRTQVESNTAIVDAKTSFTTGKSPSWKAISFNLLKKSAGDKLSNSLLFCKYKTPRSFFDFWDNVNLLENNVPSWNLLAFGVESVSCGINKLRLFFNCCKIIPSYSLLKPLRNTESCLVWREFHCHYHCSTGYWPGESGANNDAELFSLLHSYQYL